MAEFVFDRERRMDELLEDMSEAALDEETRFALHALAEALRQHVRNELLTLKASFDIEFSLGFGLDRQQKAGVGGATGAARAYRVWYGTNRKPATRKGKLVGFTGDRDTIVTFGTCDVVIPETHRIGSLGSPWWSRVVRGDDRLRIASLEALAEDAYWSSIRKKLETAESDDAVIFLHGYMTSFDEAALRAAQIGADLGIEGAMAFFSWPSRGRLLGYFADEATIEASEAQITRFLVDFSERSGAGRVHVIAHSMGNRALLRSVDRIASQASSATGKPFAQIILAAPDVDIDSFRALAGAYRAVAARTTLYVSAADLAVRASRLIHGAARIGFTPPICIVDDVDTIKVTNVDLTLLGHGYVGSARDVLRDMHDLITRDASPKERAMLRARTSEAGQSYWEIAA
ncbi:MAG TPA: alpha/beta hydrolase [Allosphingosinicella sp.]|nr:alpha/beta hydrolase [Allosphingosinicella sp.]